MLAVIHDVRPMTEEQALTAGALRMPTRSIGLSLGDRACIALAMELGATAMTCDQAWTSIDPLIISGARVDLLR